MAETNTNTNNTQKAVTFEALEEASKLLATKEEVKEQIASAVGSIANITFATTEEVLALFQPKASGGDEDDGTGETPPQE